MIAVDANILIYAHRPDSPYFDRVSRLVAELAESQVAWAIPWPCLHEFLAVVTHPRIYNPPTPLKEALAQVDLWFESPVLVLLAESERHWSALRSLVTVGRISGPRIHDARIAALCVEHGVRELWTADRDFNRFPSLRTRNPLVT